MCELCVRVRACMCMRVRVYGVGLIERFSEGLCNRIESNRIQTPQQEVALKSYLI
jgi:hypothetical protein